MPDPSTITAIVKRRYETGEYGNAHFRMPRALLDEARGQVPTPPPGSYPAGRLPGYSLGDLMGIPILVDEELPEGTWRLIDNTTGVIVHEGTVPAAAATEAPCRRCSKPFNPSDPSAKGAAQYSETGFCRGCIDRCHESTDAFHQCAVCA